MAASTRRDRYDRAAPLIAFIDLQREYQAEGRAHYLAANSKPLENCARLLAWARKMRLPVAHFRYLGRNLFFNPVTPFADWIDEFRPQANEHVFERAAASCFSNSGFDKLISSLHDPTVVFVGLAGEHGCLATAIDCKRYDVSGIFLKDCSASSAIEQWDELSSHDFIYGMIAMYSEVSNLETCVASIANKFPARTTAAS